MHTDDAPPVFSEPLEGRLLLSTGFEVAAELSGQTPVRLVPVESVAPGAVTRVAFGVPFPKGFVPAADLSRVRLLDAGGAERAAHVGLLSPWRDMAALADLPSARSVLVQADVAFPDADSDGDADPLEGWSVQWGTTARTLAPPAPLADVRSNWVRYDNAAAPAGTDYKAADNVFEPPAYALFTPDWYGRALLKTRLLPAGSDPAFAGYDAAYASFAATAVNDVDPRVAEANLIRYTTTDEPWLFDRATAFFQLAFRTGDVTYLREGHRAAQFYANHVSPQGFFDLKGDDLKYVTGEAVATDYWLTGDGRLPDVHRRMNPVFDHGQNATYTPGGFWTERHAAAKLMGYVTGYELLGDAALGQKARDTFTVYLNHQNTPPAGAPDTGLLMHQKPDHGEGGAASEWVASPWMTVLLADAVERYYLHSDDARVPAFVTRLADGLNAVGDSVYYSDDVDGTTHLQPYYLAGPNLTEAQHEFDPWGDIDHGLDVSKIFALAYYFTKKAGAPNSTYLGRFNELKQTGEAAFRYWTRPNGPASGLSVYRLSPPRKFNWWFRTTADLSWLINASFTASPPAAPSVPDLVAASDSGASGADDVTNDSTPTFSGSAEPGSTVRIFVGPTEAGSATATAGGAYSVTVSPLADGAHAVTATASNGAATSEASAALTLTVDTTRPAVEAASFEQETARRLRFRFSEQLATPVTPEALTLVNLTPGGNVAAPGGVSYDAPSRTVAFEYEARLPDGDYRATLRATSLADAAGNAAADDFSFRFFNLTGDVNRDRSVNGTDFALLAAHFGRTAMTYGQGDLNGDGSVNGTDFALLAGNFGNSLPEAPATAAPVAAVSAPPTVTPSVTRRDQRAAAKRRLPAVERRAARRVKLPAPATRPLRF